MWGTAMATLEAPVNEQLEAGNDVVLEIEVQGAMQIQKNARML